MIILDENIVASQRVQLRTWRIRFMQIGKETGRQGMKDLAQTLAGDVDDEIRSIVRGRCRGVVALLDEDHATALVEFDAAMDLVAAMPHLRCSPDSARGLCCARCTIGTGRRPGGSVAAYSGRRAHNGGLPRLRRGRGRGQGTRR